MLNYSRLLLYCFAIGTLVSYHNLCNAQETAIVVIESDEWDLIGDFLIPCTDELVPAVLMLNQAAGDRNVYQELATQLAARGIAALSLDLRGHGESINLGAFVPGDMQRDPKIWDAERDVATAHEYLKTHPRIDPERIAIVGASYSGEEMTEAGRRGGFAEAYVALSPGSFSDESIASIDESKVPWLFIASRDERFLQEITQAVRERSESVELLVLPGTSHATDLLEANPGLSERIATWLASKLTK